VVIGRFGRGITEMVQVRRMVDGVGVERRFPLNSPLVDAIEVVRRGDARRAKLYYLRDRKGKSQRLRDRRRGMKIVAGMKLAGQN
jgi:large subunit ribosomal protein L19